MLRTYDRDGKKVRVPLRCASFGPEGVWVVVEDDGEIRSAGIPGNLRTALNRRSVRVSASCYPELNPILIYFSVGSQKVELSPVGAGSYFIEYVDGTTDWCMPSEWQADVTRIENMGNQNLLADLLDLTYFCQLCKRTSLRMRPVSGSLPQAN